MGTPTNKRERSISSPAAKGMSAKRVIYVSRKDAIHVKVPMTLVAKEIRVVKAPCAGLMEYVSPVAGMSSHAVKTTPAARVSCVALTQNAMGAEGMIRPAVKGMCAKNGLSVAPMATAIPAEVMRSSAVKKSCAERAMCVDQRGYASRVEATKNHAA